MCGLQNLRRRRGSNPPSSIGRHLLVLKRFEMEGIMKKILFILSGIFLSYLLVGAYLSHTEYFYREWVDFCGISIIGLVIPLLLFFMLRKKFYEKRERTKSFGQRAGMVPASQSSVIPLVKKRPCGLQLKSGNLCGRTTIV